MACIVCHIWGVAVAGMDGEMLSEEGRPTVSDGRSTYEILADSSKKKIEALVDEKADLKAEVLKATNCYKELNIKYMNAIDALTACQQRVKELEKALKDLCDNLIVLSEDYLETFSKWPDNATIQGWDKKKWVSLLAASRSAEAALRADER